MNINRPPQNILDRPLGGRGSSRGTGDQTVSLSGFAYLYSELVQYHQNHVDSISELERRLESSGYGVGLKILELLAYRSRETRREIRLMNILQFVSTHVWKSLFGKPADSLERSIDHADEFMIIDNEPLTSTFISVPADFGQLSADAYMSGIIAGILAGAGFQARVTAHSVEQSELQLQEQQRQHALTYALASAATSTSSTMDFATLMPVRSEKAVFLVKFSPEVLSRDASMDR